MENFPIVLALTRAACNSRVRSPAVIQHAERLHEALVAQGAAEQARALALVLEDARIPPEQRVPAPRIAPR